MKKSNLVFSLLILSLFSILLVRLFYLQVVQGNQYAQFAQRNAFHWIDIKAPRGRIFDRRGQLLVSNERDYRLILHPSRIESKAATIHTLAYLLEVDPETISSMLQRSAGSPLFEPIVLATHLGYEKILAIKSRLSELQFEESGDYSLAGIELSEGHRRNAIGGEAFGHVLGYVREVSRRALLKNQTQAGAPLSAGDLVGVAGVELLFDPSLRGLNGHKEIIVDAKGREIVAPGLGLEEMLTSSLPQTGEDLYLTIDSRLQKTAYEQFKGKRGALVAIDPQTGEILALVSSPAYASDQLNGKIEPDLWKRLSEDPNHLLLNRAVQGAYPPGSVFKILTSLAGLAEKKIKPSDKIYCPGYLEFGGRRWGCWKKSGHGQVDLHRALVSSCDVYFYKLGLSLGGEVLARYARLLGLGEKTGVFGTVERAGLIPDPTWKLKTRKQPWSPSDNLGFAIGQGDVLLTPLQAALMMAEVANGGYKIHPQLSLGQKLPREKISWPLSEQDLHTIVQDLLGVVEEGQGTGGRAKIKGMQVAGKTGTAQVSILQSLPGGGKKLLTEDHAWFVAFSPVEHPKIALAIVVEHGGHGGAVAAPIAKAVLETFYDLAP